MTKTNKIRSWIVALGFALTTLASAEEVTKPVETLSALQVTLKCVALDGKVVAEVSSYIAQYPGRELYGKLPINVGGNGNKNLLIVQFRAGPVAKSPEIRFEVSDASILLQGIKGGTSSVIPLELLDVEMPRTPNEEYVIYTNEAHKLLIFFKEVKAGSNKPND